VSFLTFKFLQQATFTWRVYYSYLILHWSPMINQYHVLLFTPILTLPILLKLTLPPLFKIEEACVIHFASTDYPLQFICWQYSHRDLKFTFVPIASSSKVLNFPLQISWSAMTYAPWAFTHFKSTFTHLELSKIKFAQARFSLSFSLALFSCSCLRLAHQVYFSN